MIRRLFSESAGLSSLCYASVKEVKDNGQSVFYLYYVKMHFLI